MSDWTWEGEGKVKKMKKKEKASQMNEGCVWAVRWGVVTLNVKQSICIMTADTYSATVIY